MHGSFYEGSRGLALVAAAWLGLSQVPALAQPPAPPPPAEYQIALRYRLRTAPVERPGQFYQLLDALEALGFKKNAGPEGEEADPSVDRMTGTITSGSARKLLSDPRVQALLLAPPGYLPPEDPEAPVKVQLELQPGLGLERQRALADQVRLVLVEQGFRESAGYDHRGHTRLVGVVPAGKLDLLLQDLRWQNSGWLLPEMRVAGLAAPLRNRWPLVVTEVIPEPEGFAPAKDTPGPTRPGKGDEFLLKLAPELRTLVAPEGQAARLLRVEMILTNPIPEVSHVWDRELALLAPGLRVEGRLGQVVTAVLPAQSLAVLAESPVVASIRLPRAAAVQRAGGLPSATVTRNLLLDSGLERLHNLGHRGRGIRVAILDSDFRGWAALAGKQLPKGTRLVDLTAERSREVVADPMQGDPGELGLGTQAALGVALAAPQAELTLIRIDAASPYLVADAARYMSGEPIRSVSLSQRAEELEVDADRLALEWERHNEERLLLLNSFGQDEASIKRRAAFYEREKALRAQEQALDARRARYLELRRDLQSLKGIGLVVSNLTWSAGHAVDGSSAVSRYVDEHPARFLWFQAAGGTRGQVWAGTFVDLDGNGIMEFATPNISIRTQRWTRELNFLGWQEGQGDPRAELPAGARVRVSVQWREPHDPEFGQRGEDIYRMPLAAVRLAILRQRDPSGTKLPADSMEVVALSPLLPHRLENLPGTAVYEQTVEFIAEQSGVFALRIEGNQPEGIRPSTVPSVPAIQKSWELRLRAVVQALDAASGAKGEPVLLDYRTEEGTLGVPADARAVLTVGATSESGRPRSASATGPVLNSGLLPKPDLRFYDAWDLGAAAGKSLDRASLAAPFAAGRAACLLGSGVAPDKLLELLGGQPGAPAGGPGR